MKTQPATLPDVIALLKRAKFFILIGMMGGVVAAFAFLAAAVPFYKAQMIIGPAQPLEEQVSAGRDAVETGGDFTRFETLTGGVSVAEQLLKDEKIFQGVLHDPVMGLFRRGEKWTPEKLAEYIKRRVRIEPVGDTSLRRLVYEHPSPGFAEYMLFRIQRIADGILRDKARIQAAQRVDYLRRTSAQISNPEHRRALTDLLVQQERLLMLASIDQAFAASVVEPASSSAKPAWPDAILVLIGFIVAGGLSGFAVYGFRAA